MPPERPLVLGLDVGGTSVRCVVADATGRRLGVGQSAGANPNAVGLETAVARIREAVAAALATAPATAVAAAVMGAAGFSTQSHLDDRFVAMWAGLGLPVPLRVVGDALVGFCAGTDATSGTIVISGTGAAAVEIRDLDQGLVSDASGWLLGDDGSGQWVGREAVRHVVRPHRGIPGDALSVAVREAVLGRPQGTREDLVRALYAGSPLALSALAPVVVGLARAGDADARGILVGAADLLAASTARVRDPGDDTPVVLTGGLFASEVLHDALTRRLHEHWPGAPVLRSGSGAGGAAWLAAHDVAAGGGAVDVGPTLHRALTRLPLALDT